MSITHEQFNEIEEYATARLRVGDVAWAYVLLLIEELKGARSEIGRLRANQTDAWNRLVRHSVGLNSAVLSLANLRDHVASIVGQLEPDQKKREEK